MSSTLEAHSHKEGDSMLLKSPGVGMFRPSLRVGDSVLEGIVVGTLDVLGRTQTVLAPRGVDGQCVHLLKANSYVDYDTVVLRVGTAVQSGAHGSSQASEKHANTAGQLTFNAPMSGRFYRHPSPDEAPFVEVGSTIRHGDTIGLLEVMKTFNRLVYEGAGLPAEAKVSAIVAEDGDDVMRGAVIFELVAIAK